MRSQLRTIANEANADRKIVATTVPAVTSSDMAAPIGKFVRFHAVTKPSTLNGAGQRERVAVDGLGGRLERHRDGDVQRQQHGDRAEDEDDGAGPVDPLHAEAAPGRSWAGAFEDLGGLDRFDDESWLNRHQRAFLPRVIESWMTAMRTVMTKNTVAFAIWKA